MSKELREQILSILQQEEQKLVEKIPPYGLGIMEIARLMDIYVVLPSVFQDMSEEDQLFITLGFNKALNIMLNDAHNNQMLPLARSENKLHLWAYQFTIFCGRIALCERYLEFNRVGLCTLEKTEKGFLFRLNNKNMGLERIEREYFVWNTQQAEKEQSRYLNQSRRKRLKLHKEMRSLVQMSRRYYMTYDTNPHIDDYYDQLGKTQTAKIVGYDGFSKKSQFGGIEFGLYCKAVEVFVGWSMKHVNFAHLLLKKRANLNPRNLYTLINPRHRVIRYLQNALDIDYDISNQITDIMTLSERNAQQHFDGPSTFVAPTYIEIGDDRLITPVWGNLTNPFSFLLVELKNRYPNDWFRNVNEREEIFRNDLYALFTEDRFVKIHKPIVIRQNGKVITDIDAVIYDRATQTVGLFQLKFQDVFGKSLRQRSNRKEDMLKANKWIESITKWLNESSENAIQKALTLENLYVKKDNINLFVIGRYAAHFSGSDLPDSRAVWGTWLQVRKIMEENPTFSLNNFFNELKNQSPYNRKPDIIEQETIVIGNVEFTITVSDL